MTQVFHDDFGDRFVVEDDRTDNARGAKGWVALGYDGSGKASDYWHLTPTQAREVAQALLDAADRAEHNDEEV